MRLVNGWQRNKRFNTITSIVDLSLITSTVNAGEISIAEFTSGNGLPVGIALSGTSLIFSIATAITRKSFKIFTVKQERHDAIKLLAFHRKMHDGDFQFIEFEKVLQEVEKYLKIEADLRNQAKTKVRQTTQEEQEELLEQERKEGKEDFLRNIANATDIHCVNTI